MNTKSNSILIVEDDEVFAEAITRTLKGRGFTCFHAHNVDKANELIQSEIPDFAILDLNLNGETSLKLIPTLRRISSPMRILVLTGYASIATAVEAIKLGADNYLAKPADTDEILAAIFADFEKDVVDLNKEPKLETMSVRRLEWEHIQRILMENNGNVSATARQLNMHRRTLQRKLQKKPVTK